MRVTSTPVLIGLLVGAALLTTVWTATSLQPTSPHLLGFRPAALDSSRWARTADDAVSAPADVRYERVPERFLLRQLVRAFLAAPWLMPDAGKSRTPRPTAASRAWRCVWRSEGRCAWRSKTCLFPCANQPPSGEAALRGA